MYLERLVIHLLISLHLLIWRNLSQGLDYNEKP